MANRTISEEQLDRILSSLDGLQKAEPAPFFYTRLQARMNRTENSTVQQLIGFVTRPAFALGIGLMILVLNGYFLVNVLQQKEAANEESTQMLAIEYSSLNTPFYETSDETP